jgi:restriction system protein
MSDITLQRVGELLRGVFEILWNKPEGLTAKEVLKQIPETIKLTEYELSLSPSTNAPRYERIVRLATIPLARAGWLIKNDKGRWFITEEGRQASKRYTNVQDFYKEVLRLYDERRQIVPESVMTLELAQEMAWEQIKRYLLQMKHPELQSLFTDLLQAMGYHIAWSAPSERQRGLVDLVVQLDPLGMRNKRVFVQIKHKGQAVTAEGLRSFSSILGTDDEFGIIFSTGGFTNEATQELNSSTIKKISFLDLMGFFDLWRKYYPGLNQEARALLPLRAIHFLSITDA